MQITAIKFTGHDEEGFFLEGLGGFLVWTRGFKKRNGGPLGWRENIE